MKRVRHVQINFSQHSTYIQIVFCSKVSIYTQNSIHIREHIDFNTILFPRSKWSWSTPQFNKSMFARIEWNFECIGKLLTGRKFLKGMSRPGFLSNGKTKASFQATGNWPDFKDILINLVSTGSRTSHRLTKVEGIGSRAQDFRDECCIRDFTSCSVNILNLVRWTKDDSMPSMSGYDSLQHHDNRGDS